MKRLMNQLGQQSNRLSQCPRFYNSVKLYSRDHEWIEYDQQTMEGRLGITKYAKDQLGDIVYIEFPEVGQSFGTGDSMGQLESVKTVGELYMPFQATILDINDQVQDDSSVLNDINVEQEGWLIKVKINELDTEQLMDHEKYSNFLQQQ